MRNNDYDITKGLLDKIRNAGHMLKEEQEKQDPIAITNSPRFGTNVLQSQIDAFRSAVDPGAVFSGENESDPESNPLVFYPNTGNLVFSGMIPTLSNLKFQISINDVTRAPYIFVDGLSLTPPVIEVLNKLAGFADNFIRQWSAASDSLSKLRKKED